MSNFKKKFNERGIAALSTMLLIGGIVVEVATAGLLASYLVSQEGFGLKASNKAFFSAMSGINDATLMIVRNGDSISANSYNLDVDGITVSVVIAKTILLNNDSKYTIESTAIVLGKERKIQSIVIVGYTTGLVKVESVSEI